ncbi:hypothetical protein F5Y16DRAFT_406183 [Xylariaceae sp. FL0255]|nr:hypothetical protein F5Y16DRAFT_406183 [Xylariaceae sp. FL0255]
MPSRPHITLEEAFLASSAREYLETTFFKGVNWPAPIVQGLVEASNVRIKSMDAGHVSIQVLSHMVGPLPPDLCRKANDEMAAAVANPNNTGRLAAFAVLPISHPASCAEELHRCITDLGFVGALIDARAGGTYYDGDAYEPMWAMAEKLGVPVYLHPTLPTPTQVEGSYAPAQSKNSAGDDQKSFSPNVAQSLGAFAWGWHSDAAISVLRLYAAGVFDRYPKLKIVLGHFGEMIPFMLDRVEKVSSRGWGLQRSFKEVWRTNFWITTSGCWSVDPMATILRNTAIDRILYSVDYPFFKNEDGLLFIQELEQSGLVTPEQMDRIAYKNAEELLGLKVMKTFD